MALLLRRARFSRDGGLHDVLVEGDRIAELGLTGTLAADLAPVIDLDGRYLGPGLWDEHLHFTQWVIRRRRFDLAETSSAAQVLDRLRERLAQGVEPDEILFGYGFRDGLWADAPTLEAIDAVAPGIPVILISGDLHCAWMTSSAAAQLNLVPDASGVFREGPWIAASRDLHAANQLPMSAFREAAEAAARRGVVGVVEYENTDNVTEWPARVAAGIDSLRVEAAVWPDRLEEAIAAGLRTGDPLDDRGLVSFGRLKVVVDGSLNTRTALCWDPYPGLDPHAEHACGIASVSTDELRRLLRRAREGGIEAAVHAIGDRAGTEVLDAFEELGMHGIVEHAQLLAETDFPRFAQLGMIVGIQPEHAMDDRDVADRHWAGRTGRAFAYGSLHAAGAQLRLGSDAPVSPLDPWEALASATVRSRGDREPWHPEQRIPFDVAMAASTRGRLTVQQGEVADLVVTETDPATAERDALRGMVVSATLLGGRFTWNGL